MKRVSLLCAVAAAATMMVPSANAELFNISFSGPPTGFSGSGIFNATDDGGGMFTVTQVYGGSVTDGFTGTSSSIADISTFDGADNLLSFPSATYFDLNGLSFDLANGQSVNLFYDGFSEGALRSDGDLELVTDAVSIAPTPEPSSFVLLGTAAMMGMGDLVRRRRRSIA